MVAEPEAEAEVQTQSELEQLKLEQFAAQFGLLRPALCLPRQEGKNVGSISHLSRATSN